MNNDKFKDKLSGPLEKAIRDYNDPPETPREAIWARIEAQRQAERVVYREDKPPFWSLRMLWWPAAAVAVLILGIVIGRISMPIEPAPLATDNVSVEDGHNVAIDNAAPPPADGRRSGQYIDRSAFQLAAVPVLSQTELLLAQYRSGEALGGEGQTFSERASGLLADTRLLLDSPAADDRELRSLLNDLELILARIVRISSDDSNEDRDLINDSLKQRSILPRLRSKVPNSSLAAYI